MFDAEQYIAEYQSFSHGTARLRAMKKAIQAADEAKSTEWSFLFRHRYINESVFESDDVDAMVIFPEMLALYDSSEELQADDENTRHLMWSFKYILENATGFTHIPLTQIESLYAEFKKRLTQYGYSLRTYYYMRENFSLSTDIPLPPEEVGQYQQLPPDDLKDCAACEASHAVRWALRDGDRAEAERLSRPIFSGEIHCTEVPESTYNSWIAYDLKNGDYAHARMLARRLYPLIRRRMDLLAENGTLLSLYAMIDRRIGLTIFRNELQNYLSCRNHRTKLDFAVGAYHLFREMRPDELSVILPADFPLFQPEHHYQTAALRDYFYNEAKPLAEAFDARNGNTARCDALEAVYPAYDEEAVDLLHCTVEPNPSALAAVCQTLPDALTVETVKERLAQTGRFSAELSHADAEQGLLAFQITDKNGDAEDVWQVFLAVQPVPPLDDFRPAAPVPSSLRGELAKAEAAVVCVMPFDDVRPDRALHVQLTLLHTLFPGALAYLDLSRLKVLPAGWVRLAAESAVAPQVDYLYTLRLSGDETHDQIWITTQGLSCCGLRELEIWDATKENYRQYADFLCFAAERILLRGTMDDAGMPFTVLRRADGEPVVCTWLPAAEAAADYPDSDPGADVIRRDMLGDSYDERADAAVLYFHGGTAADGTEKHSRLRFSAEDFESLRYGTFIATGRKTAALAKERFGLFCEALAATEDPAYVCIQLPGDDEEEVWLAVDSVDGAQITGTFAEECSIGEEGKPYTASPDMLTDFTLRLQGIGIRPDTAFLIPELLDE